MKWHEILGLILHKWFCTFDFVVSETVNNVGALVDSDQFLIFVR